MVSKKTKQAFAGALIIAFVVLLILTFADSNKATEYGISAACIFVVLLATMSSITSRPIRYETPLTPEQIKKKEEDQILKFQEEYKKRINS